MRTLGTGIAALVLCLAASADCAPARADFSSASLLSGGPRAQFEEANAPVLSAEGQYAVFQGSLGGVSGVYRRDLTTGAIETVAVAEPSDPAISAPDASAPSVSADGRYVAFTTTADLEPETDSGPGGQPEGEPALDRGCPEVYVRDMSLPAQAPAAYTLAAELNGGNEGISFGGGCSKGAFAVAGAQSAPGVALSADGREIVFTLLSRSNLASGPGGQADTPASQVVVRDLQTRATVLVSSTPEGAPTPGGGAFPSEQSEQRLLGSTVAATLLGDQLTGSTAAISADGSTVAWLGTDVPAQVPGSALEIESNTYHESGQQPGPAEVEPLWRRIADGPAATTRRLLGGAGLDLFYSRQLADEVVTGGSFVDTVSLPLFIAPALSANGQIVALISNAPQPAAVRSAELDGQMPTSDAYVAHVADDPTVPVQVTPVTETPDYDAQPDALGFIDDVAISPDGSRMAFESQRTEFTLPSLSLVSPPTAYSGDAETYEANLALGTLQRVTVTYDGLPPNGTAGLVAFSGDGHSLTFASQARNLFYGDATKASQVYETHELSDVAPPAQQQLTAPPVEAGSEEWRLSAVASARRDGSVVVSVQVPGAGRLSVAARAQLPASAAGAKSSRRRRQSRRNVAGSRARSRASRVLLLLRTVASGGLRAASAEDARVALRAGGTYQGLVDSRGGLYTVLVVRFTAPGRPVLVKEIPVTFRRAATGARRAARRAAHRPHAHANARAGAVSTVLVRAWSW